MAGNDKMHLIGDRWGRIRNIDVCAEAEPTTTWPYMIWIQPSTHTIRVRNAADTGWIICGGNGGGGAPVDAQYLVLALNSTLTAERRLVAGDGLDLADGGAGGDATLTVDVSDIAGAGLEDDGVENLRIAAAAAGDGLQGGGGSPLAIDSTVVRTSGAQTIAGVKTLQNNLALDDGAGDSPEIRLVGGSNNDTAIVFLDDDPTAGRSDIVIKLPGNDHWTQLEVRSLSGGTLFTVRGDGDVNLHAGGLTLTNGALTQYRYAELAIWTSIITALTDTMGEIARWQHNTSNTPLAGFGGYLRIDLEDSSGNPGEAARIGVVWEATDWLSPESAFVVEIRPDGNLAEALRLNMDGLKLVLDDMFIDIDERSAAPSNPDTGRWRLYPKSDGFYQLEDNGTETSLAKKEPSGIIVLWDNSDDCPTGYTEIAGAANRIPLLVASGPGGTGGTTTHSHSLTIYSTAPNMAVSGSVVTSSYPYLHYCSGGAGSYTVAVRNPDTDAKSHLYSYYEFVI